MDFEHIIPDKSVSLFVKSIMVFEEETDDQKTILPFFADGYPGLVFYEAPKVLTTHPHNKEMPAFFLYGQTLKPIELVFESRYKMIVFQFYPFILKSFFGIEPKNLNDDCYDLLQSRIAETANVLEQLQNSTTSKSRIEIISAYLHAVFIAKRQSLDAKLKQALQIIIDNKGQLAVQDVYRQVKMNKKTFERRFANATGLLPKHFTKIIQFQSSLEQLTVKDFNKLTDIVYENGFADQSHFIKVFKAFTGKTPRVFLK